MRIAFFDSGIGGLTIIRPVIEAMPEYDYVYYGDTRHLPYGDKTEEEIYDLTRRAIQYLFKEESVLIAIIACNTASAETLRRLQDSLLPKLYPDRRILGVIIPTIEEIIERGALRPLLFATKRTVNSEKYQTELNKRNMRNIELRSQSVPSLVPLIELGKFDEAVDAIADVLDAHIVAGGDSVVLGCTHYTLLKDVLRRRYGDSLLIISQDEIIPSKLRDYLMRHPEIESRLTNEGYRKIFLSDNRERYRHYIQDWFNAGS